MSTTIESLELEILTNSKSAESGITALTKSLNKLNKATQGSGGLNKVAEQLEKINKSLKPAATQMKKFSDNLKATSSSVNQLTKSNDKSSASLVKFGAKLTAAYLTIKKVGTLLSQSIKKSSEYIENINLFSVAMGEYANEAKAYAETVGEAMGIDPGEWMRYQGILQTLATGFGVASDKASIMSKNLTQLGYDISSFYNLDIDEAMEKLQSGLAGELEPLRRIGYDLSQAKLEATALSLGITKSISDMTQAEKAMLRYYAIMTQVTTVQGDMARTLEQPANQMRIFKAQLEMLVRSIGNIFIPILNKVLPYLIAMTQVLRELVSSVANLVGFEMPEVDYTGVDSLASGSDDTASALEDATESAKKLKSTMAGFDELNVINPNTDSAATDDTVSSVFDIELPEYDFLGEATNERVEGIVAKIKELLKPIGDLIDMTVEWAKALDLEPISKGFEKIGTSLESVLSITGDVFGWVYEEVLLPIAKWVIEAGLPAAFDMISKAVGAVNDSLKPVIEGIKELKPVLEPIIKWIGDEVVTVFEDLGNIFAELGKVFTEKGGKIKATIKGIGDIIRAIWDFLKPILDFLKPILSDLFDTVVTMVGGIVGNIIDIVAGIVDFVAGIFTGDWDRAWNGVKDIFSGLGEFIKDIFSGLWKIISRIFKPVAKWFNDKVIKPVANFFKKLWEDVSGFFVNLWEDISGFFVNLWEGIKGIWNTVAEWFYTKVIQPVVGFFKGLWDSVAGFFTQLWEDIKGVWNTVATWFNENVITPVVNFFKFLWESVSGFFVSLWNDIVAIWGVVANWFNENVITPLVNFFAPIVEWISTFFYGCWLIIQAVWVVVSTWFNENVITPVVNFFKDLCEKVAGFFVSLWNDIVAVWNTVSTWFNEKVIVPVVGLFKFLWEKVSGFFVSLWKDIVSIWGTVSTWFNEKVIIPVVNFFKSLWGKVSTFFVNLWNGIVAIWVAAPLWIKENVIIPVVELFRNVWTAVSGFFSSLWEDIKNVWKNVSTWFNEKVIVPTVRFFEGVWVSVSGFFVSLWDDIKSVWAKVSTWFNDNIIKPVQTAFSTACEKIGEFFSNLWLGVRKGVATAMNAVIGAIESVLNWLIEGINKLVGGFNKVVQWAADILGADWGGLSLLQKVEFQRVTVPTYADGGFPESGQAFVARENGIPEMVGTIGRRTAVANNEQIVESVASGVAEANSEQNALLREQNSLLRALLEKDSGVYLDGRSLSDSVDKYKREQGRAIITGGVL